MNHMNITIFKIMQNLHLLIHIGKRNSSRTYKETGSLSNKHHKGWRRINPLTSKLNSHFLGRTINQVETLEALNAVNLKLNRNKLKGKMKYLFRLDLLVTRLKINFKT